MLINQLITVGPMYIYIYMNIYLYIYIQYIYIYIYIQTYRDTYTWVVTHLRFPGCSQRKLVTASSIRALPGRTFTGARRKCNQHLLEYIMVFAYMLRIWLSATSHVPSKVGHIKLPSATKTGEHPWNPENGLRHAQTHCKMEYVDFTQF